MDMAEKLARSRGRLEALRKALAGSGLSVVGRAAVLVMQAKQAAVIRYREKLPQ
jgi:hypothetical protein